MKTQFKKHSKRILALLMGTVLMFCLIGCEKDLKKTAYKKDLDIAISAEPTSIAALEPEITKIASEYDQDGILTEALAIFKGDTELGAEKGDVFFTYCRDEAKTERATIVIITYNMFEKKATKVSYEQGNGMFTATTKEPIEEETRKITFASIFEMLRNDNNMGKKLAGENIKLSLEFTSEGLKTSLI